MRCGHQNIHDHGRLHMLYLTGIDTVLDDFLEDEKGGPRHGFRFNQFLAAAVNTFREKDQFVLIRFLKSEVHQIEKGLAKGLNRVPGNSPDMIQAGRKITEKLLAYGKQQIILIFEI